MKEKSTRQPSGTLAPKDNHVSFRVSPELKRLIRERARHERRKPSELMRLLLEDALMKENPWGA
jgi:hypothetical protein